MTDNHQNNDRDKGLETSLDDEFKALLEAQELMAAGIRLRDMLSAAYRDVAVNMVERPVSPALDKAMQDAVEQVEDGKSDTVQQTDHADRKVQMDKITGGRSGHIKPGR